MEHQIIEYGLVARESSLSRWKMIVPAMILALGAFYAYGYVRTVYIGCSLSVSIKGAALTFVLIGPFACLFTLVTTCERMRRAMAFAGAMIVGCIIAEGWCNVEEQLLLHKYGTVPALSVIHDRWWPFGDRSVVFDLKVGWYAQD